MAKIHLLAFVFVINVIAVIQACRWDVSQCNWMCWECNTKANPIIRDDNGVRMRPIDCMDGCKCQNTGNAGYDPYWWNRCAASNLGYSVHDNHTDHSAPEYQGRKRKRSGIVQQFLDLNADNII